MFIKQSYACLFPYHHFFFGAIEPFSSFSVSVLRKASSLDTSRTWPSLFWYPCTVGFFRTLTCFCTFQYNFVYTVFWHPFLSINQLALMSKCPFPSLILLRPPTKVIDISHTYQFLFSLCSSLPDFFLSWTGVWHTYKHISIITPLVVFLHLQSSPLSLASSLAQLLLLCPSLSLLLLGYSANCSQSAQPFSQKSWDQPAHGGCSRTRSGVLAQGVSGQCRRHSSQHIFVFGLLWLACLEEEFSGLGEKKLSCWLVPLAS